MQTVLIAALILASSTAQIRYEGDFASYATPNLGAVIGNNAEWGDHRPWYNGVFELHAPEQHESPFVAAYAGWNLEHYFDARPRHDDRAILFEPRSAPMVFRRPAANMAELYQPKTPYFGVSSTTRFEIKDPYIIDVSFECTPHKALEGGFLGCFWASYMNAPENKSMYFLREGSSLDEPRWTQLCTQEHDRDSTVLPASGDAGIEFEMGAPILWQSISPLRYSEPFFYGRFRNMALIYLFEPGKHIRFSHSPSGGGSTPDGTDTNPAWDFQFIVPDAAIGKTYGFRGRLIYKPWEGRDDVLQHARDWFSQF